jgi:hypothetical protein
MRDDLRPGAFWMAVGDAWVAEATRPPPLPPPQLPAQAPPAAEVQQYPPTMPPLPGLRGV